MRIVKYKSLILILQPFGVLAYTFSSLDAEKGQVLFGILNNFNNF